MAEFVGETLLKQGFEVWLDKWDLFAGESLTTKIGDAIDACDAFVVLLSPHATGSKWVKEELRIAVQRRFAEEDFRIIPVILAQCTLPPFLRDYLYVDFRSGASAGCQALVAALRRSSPKPLPKSSGPAISYRRTSQTLEFVGARGEHTLVRESFVAVPLRDLTRIDRNIFYSGRLGPVRCDKFVISSKAISPNYQKLLLKSKMRRVRGRAFEFSLAYELFDTFVQREEFWVYTIEAPTDECRLTFDFSRSTRPKSIGVKHRQGSTALPEAAQPVVRDGSIYTWTKAFPEYKDSYEFRIAWPLTRRR